MANTSKTRDTYSTPGIDVGDGFEPAAKAGRKTTHWNTQVEILTAAPGVVPVEFYGDHVDDDGNPTDGAPIPTSEDVRKGWKFYPGAQTKFHDGPNKYPGIERRTGMFNGTEGLFLRFNPLLKAEIESKTSAADRATNPPPNDAKSAD